MIRSQAADEFLVTSAQDELPPPSAASLLVEELLAPGGIRAHLQPVVRVADGAVIGHEVLSRAEAFPTVSPASWLADAESVGRRAEVELACLDAAAALGEPPNRALLFVNVSPDVLLDPRFALVVARLPRHVIEVTEHAAVEGYGPLRGALRRFRGSGSLVAVDDVGSGYASMAHVLQLHPSFIKIDCSLVQGLDSDPGRRALVEALQAFSTAIGALTVAEGVETEAELRALQEIGVDLAQGYLLARPSPRWAEVSRVARNILAPTAPLPAASDDGSLVASLDAASTAVEACDVAGRYLARRGGLLPSIYLERGGVLRCHSRRGQWLVMDGLRPGSGITGAAYATGTEIICDDVSDDPRYRLAVPGVCAEVAVPLFADGLVIGVLNLDTVTPLHDEHVALARRTARVLQERLVALGSTGGRSSTMLHELARLAPTLALAGSPADLCRALLSAATDLTGFASACLWAVPASAGLAGHDDVAGTSPTGTGTAGTDPTNGTPYVDGAADCLGVADPVLGAPAPRAQTWFGPGGTVLASLPPDDVAVLANLVADLSSCYSGGTDLSLDTPPTQALRRNGARGAILVPIRDGWRLTDLLVLTSASTAFVPPDVVDALENLCLQAGSRLAALRRVAELEEIVHRDALTGVGNRGLWDVAVAAGRSRSRRARPDAGEPVWVAVADVDNFKAVNDTRGHLVGDALLRRLAEVFDALPGWSVFRLGGDEFALFGPTEGEAAHPHALADVVAEAQEMLAEYGAAVSVGAALTTRDRIGAARARADRALYRRKRAGGKGLTVAAAGSETGATPIVTVPSQG